MCRARKQRNKDKYRKAGRCPGCGTKDTIPGEYCPHCVTAWHKGDRPIDDEEAYMAMLRESKNMRSVCAVTGRSLLALRKVGEKLSIDRINPYGGYTIGNMRLLALSLNVAKGNRRTVPQSAINKLLRKLDRVVNDRLSRNDGATTPR